MYSWNSLVDYKLFCYLRNGMYTCVIYFVCTYHTMSAKIFWLHEVVCVL